MMTGNDDDAWQIGKLDYQLSHELVQMPLTANAQPVDPVNPISFEWEKSWPCLLCLLDVIEVTSKPIPSKRKSEVVAPGRLGQPQSFHPSQDAVNDSRRMM